MKGTNLLVDASSDISSNNGPTSILLLFRYAKLGPGEDEGTANGSHIVSPINYLTVLK